MGCAEGFVRATMFVFNFLIWLAGLAILAIGIFVAVDNPFKNYFTVTVNTSQTYWIVVLVIIFVTAAILVGIGFLGCCGACQESSCMLNTYAVVLIVMILLEVVGIILIAVFHNQIEADLQKNMVNQITASYYNETSKDALSQAWNQMMKDLKCCGVFDYRDWNTSQYVAMYPNNPVPSTCCRWDNSMNQPANITSCYLDARGYVKPPNNGTFTDLYATGCLTQIEDLLQQNKVIVIAILAAVAAAMLLGVFAACCLAKSYS